MEEGTTGIAPESTAAPEVAPPEVQASETQTELPSGDESLLDVPPQTDDDAEDEIDGVKLKGKKEALEKLKAERLMQADYTRKTQAAADERRAFEAQQAEFQRTAQFHQQHIAEVAKVISIDERLQQFSQLNWDQLLEADPIQYQKLDRQVRQLQSDRAQLTQSIAQKQQVATFQQQQVTARQMEEGQRELEREIKGWSPELKTKLAETAKSIGFKPEELAQVSDPRAVKLLHKAYLYDQLMAQRAAKAPAPPATPVTRIQARASTAVTDPDKLSPDEWRKWRENQLAEQRKKSR